MDTIEKFLMSNSQYIITSATMIIGIFAGWIPAIKSKFWKIFSIILLALMFVLLTEFSYTNKVNTLIAIIMSIFWIISSILLFAHKKGIVKRRKVDRMIRKFTSDADREQPICIFGGDLDFFGNCILPLQNTKILNKLKYKKTDISKNKQFLQLKTGICFREIHILSVKPNSSNENDILTRRRIGFLKSELGEILTIKFFQSQECHTCNNFNICTTCEVCNNCDSKESCKNKITHCDKLQYKCSNMCYNPDTKLRGRFFQKKKDDSMSAVIVTTNKSGKSYILKEYSHGTKEYSTYRMIWDVWWKKCEEDEAFIKRCIKEYEEFIKAGV